MTVLDFLNAMKEYANDYRRDSQRSLERNRHMNNIESGEKVHQRHIDAVLADFINYIGCRNAVDYGLYTKDFTSLTPNKNENETD